MGSKIDQVHSIFQIRLILGGLIASAVLLPDLYQPLISSTYAYLRTTTVYRASTFETFWTVFWYAVIEVCMTVTFLKHPEWRLPHSSNTTRTTNASPRATATATPSNAAPRPKGMRRPTRRLPEILTYMAPLLTLDLTLIKKFADVPLEDMLRSGNYDPDTPLRAHPLSTARSPYFLAPTLHNFTPASPLQTTRALPTSAPSSRRLVLELTTALIIYDALFFLFHLALHRIPFLNRWHAPHHSHGAMHPQVTNQLSIPERLGLVLLANASLNGIGAHVLTRTAFVPVFVWLLVELHCGMDVPWGLDKVMPRGWAGGARKHALHHAGGKGGVEPFFGWWDGVVG